MTSLRQKWTACVLKLDTPEDGKFQYKAYARYDGGTAPVYDSAAVSKYADHALQEAQALTQAYNHAGMSPRDCEDIKTTAQLPSGKIMTDAEIAAAPKQTQEERDANFLRLILGEKPK